MRAKEAIPQDKVSVEARQALDGIVTLKVNGVKVGSGKTNGSLSIYPAGELSTGADLVRSNPVIRDYDQGSSRFRTSIGDLVLEFGKSN